VPRLTIRYRVFIVNNKVNNKSRAHQRTLTGKLGGKVRKEVTLSFEYQKDTQISGFISCLQALLSRYNLTICEETFKQHFRNEFRNIEVSQMAKIFKLSLATYFSKNMGQELPEDYHKSVSLFPRKWEKLIFKCCHTFKKRLTFGWDLLQCKDLAQPVPKDMIKQAYEKHWKTLSSVGESPKSVLSLIRSYFREFAEKVQKEFVIKSKLPPKSAYYNSKKSEGGCLNYFKENKNIISNIYEKRSDVYDDWRIDPVVIHLIGKPGKGKSYLVDKLCKRISSRFGIVRSVYQRSIATDHWDGYNGQLISVIDDIFSEADGTTDQKQIIQICSNVPTVLPMADLKEKGMKFNSDFLILTSNYIEKTMKIMGKCVVNTDAVLRRVFPAYEILDYKNQKYRVQFKTVKEFDTVPGIVLEMTEDELLNRIVTDSLKIHRVRAKHEAFTIPVTCNGPFESNLGFRVPITPPDRLPRVKAHAIPEPLKVRMITKAEEELWVLKPVQKAMWKALQHFKCFELTGTPKIDLDFIDSWKGTHLLSGDYEAATDNLHQDIMELAVDELSKVIPSPFKEWLKFESGHHVVDYPEWTQLPEIIQTRGQLMGSLLSFPILCVANAACIGIIKKQSLDELEALINGDDILFRDSLRKIESWKKLTKTIGLKPSIGKNYCSENFGSINSQLVIRENNQHRWIRSGCFGGISKVSNYLSNFRLALEIEPQNLGNHLLKAQKLLRTTPQSVFVPEAYGGLGVNFFYPKTQHLTKLENEVYFYKLIKEKCDILTELDDTMIVRIPKHLYHKYRTVIQGKNYQELPDLEKEDESLKPFDYKQFHRFQKWYQTVPLLRERIKSSYLPKEIPLNVITTVTLKVCKSLKPLLNNLKTMI
jgi:hypothetical protein